MLRWLLILFVGIVLLAAGGVLMFVRGSFGLDDWIVRQIIAIHDTYIVPEIEFESFNYVPPRTVELRGARLTAADGTDVLKCDGLTLTLKELPRRGRPLTIERIDLERPTLRLIRERDRKGVTFKGLVPFVKTDNITNQEQVDDNVRISNVLEIHQITMVNGGIFYDPADGDPPMDLDQIAFTMDVDHTLSTVEKGWYGLAAVLDQGSIIDLDLRAQFNIDTLESRIEALSIQTDLDEESYSALPPSLQSLLREHDVHGWTRIEVVGFASMLDPTESDLRLAFDLEDSNFALDEYRLYVDELKIRARVIDGLIKVTTCEMSMLRGQFELPRAWLDLNHPIRHAEVSWYAENLHIQDLLRTRVTEGEPPRFAGVLSSFGQVEADLAVGADTIDGHGELHITDGRFLNSSVMEGLSTIIGLRRAEDAPMRDRADLVFDITPFGIDLSRIEAATSTMLARGSGTISWGGELDWGINAGPMERIQSQLGAFGKILGGITDRFVTYHVTGPMGDARVRVRPLGL